MRKEKLMKLFSIFTSLMLIFYSLGGPLFWTGQVYARQKVCDPIDEDYQECLADNERDRLEEERETQREQIKAQAEQLREEREAISEEHEDDPTWVAPWLITPTPTPIPASEDPTSQAENFNTGEGSKNLAESNSASTINVENINSTTLDENLDVVSNSGNNLITGEDSNYNPSSSNPPLENTQGEVGNSQISQIASQDNLTQQEENDLSSGEGQLSGSLGVDSSGQELGNGEDADVFGVSEDNDEVTVGNTNTLEMVNDMGVNSTSGKNKVLENEDDTSLESGKTVSGANLDNLGNVNSTEVKGRTGALAENAQTEDGSTNFTKDEKSLTLRVENNNQAAVENNVSVSSTSGANEVSKNEGDGALTSGEVDIIVNLLNILNLNITGSDFIHLIVNIFGNLAGELDLDDISEKYLGMDEEEFMTIARNTSTGENSENEAIAKNTENLDIDNKNQAALINNVEVQGVSGGNDLAGNEGNVDVLTGRIKILTSILNFINANFSGTDWYFAMINIFGSVSGDIVLPDPNKYLQAQGAGAGAVNNQTGDDSQNEVQAVSLENLDVSNNNQAQVINDVSAVGDSGTNISLENEDETTIETGKVDVLAQITNWINYNIAGNRWTMVIVNVFGKWLGKIIAFPGQGDIEAPQEGTLVALATGQGSGSDVLAENSQTGNDSQNFSQASSEKNLEVENENKAYLENNIDVSGVSGQNTTSENEDNVNISTGWIDLGVNLFNIVNFNVTGRDWMLLIVNVFGDFLGNIVFPHEELAQTTNLEENTREETIEGTDSMNFGSSGIGGNENSPSGQNTEVQTDSQAVPEEDYVDSSEQSIPIVNLMKEDKIKNFPVLLGTTIYGNSETKLGLDFMVDDYYNRFSYDINETYILSDQGLEEEEQESNIVTRAIEKFFGIFSNLVLANFEKMKTKNNIIKVLTFAFAVIVILVGISLFIPGIKAMAFTLPSLPDVPGFLSSPFKPEPPNPPSVPTSNPMPTSPFAPTATPTPRPGTITPTPSVTGAITPGGGGGTGGTGGTGGSSGGGGGVGGYYCGATTPPVPYLRSLKSLGDGKVELVWDPVSPVTH